MEKYKKYNMRYDVIDKILFVYTPMLVKDFIKMRAELKKENVELRIIER